MAVDDYARIEKAILFLEAHVREQPTLAQLARAVGLSPYHFQRLFRRWAGISPKRFAQFLTADHAKRLLRASHPVLEVAGEVGLSGGGRLHDLLVGIDAVTPGELKREGAGLTIRYGVHASPFGECLLAATDRGICALSFLAQDRDRAVAALRAQWPRAVCLEDPRATAPLAARIFRPLSRAAEAPLTLWLQGTNFQVKVWEALLRIPAGTVTSYQALAAGIGAPRASRAVARAVADNAVAFLIPCHRVIRKNGAFGGYRWGEARKKAMLAWEAARADEQPVPQPPASQSRGFRNTS